jgi:phage shock protein E
MNRFVLGAVAAMVGVVLADAAEHTKDSLETVKKAVIDGTAVLVDVREANEWSRGHLKDAKHVALSDLKAGLPADKLKAALPPGKVVYLHCASGRRCLAAADLLTKLGYDARALKDGFNSLAEAGFEKAR